TTPRPEPKAHGLTADQLDDGHVKAEQLKTERELRQLPYRLISAFLVPLTAVAAAYVALVGDTSLSAPPPFEWIVYLGVSLILAAIAARLQTQQHADTKVTYDDFVSIGDRRSAYLAADRKWLDDQKRRTTTAFWLQDIPKSAAEKGMGSDDVFAQEVAKLFVAWTWNVKLNQRVHDYGVDIFGRGKEGSAVIQCKHGTESGPNASDIRDLAGSRHAFAADYGLLISIHPPLASPQNEFFSDKGQLEFWHLGHVLEQCITLFKQRTGEDAPGDDSRQMFLNEDGTPIVRQTASERTDDKMAAE
ncbi:MAG: restriction endonuclease, partial [Alphaproteobacteria bacterium]|nr:restriction endonuclease [Alphaproteobacteria bacterium]